MAPVVYPPENDVDLDLHIWDTWFLRNRDGTIAEIDGYRVVFSLTASSELFPGKRHDVATIRHFYSRDGREWTCGGPVFEDGAEQRSASSRTQSGDDRPVDLGPVRPRDPVVPGRDGVRARRPVPRNDLHLPQPVVLRGSPDRRDLSAVRDQHADSRSRTRGGFDAEPEHLDFNGSVGIAVSPSGDPTDWELESPLLEGAGTNQELERPHVVVRDGRYYLFLSSHEHTFAEGLEGYDALYGFVADSLRGEYVPLNESGLVLTNPPSAPFQTYSWLAYPHREEILVNSFFNYYDLRGLSLDDVTNLSLDEQQRRFGGTWPPRFG